MNEKQWKKFLQQEMDKEMEEIDGILEEMDQNPETKDIVAPEAIHEKLLAQIQAGKEQEERLSDEEKELIRLGKVYKKRRKWNKVLVAIAAVVCAMAIGVTAFGGPERVIEKFERMIGGRKQEYVNNDDERTDEIEVVDEAEAYQQIEDKFGVNTVQLYYLPEGVEFKELILTESTQNVHLNYVGDNQEAILYFMNFNYRTGSTGIDVEDTLLEEYKEEVDGNMINVKKYLVEENQTNRYIINYEYSNVYYLLQLNNIEEVEVEKIIENLYFR